MMIAAMLAVILMMLCPSISAIPAPGYALSPLVQHLEQCTHALSTFVQLGDTTPWLEHTSNVIHGSKTQPVSGVTSLIIYDTTKTQAASNTCSVSSKPSRTTIEVLLTIDGPVAIQASPLVHDTSKTRPLSIHGTTPAGSSQSTAVISLIIDEPISTKAGEKGVVNPTLPTCAATTFISLIIDESISTKAGGKVVVSFTLPTQLALPTCAATAFHGNPPINKTITVAGQQPNLLLSELEAILAPQAFRLASLIDHSKLRMNLRRISNLTTYSHPLPFSRLLVRIRPTFLWTWSTIPIQLLRKVQGTYIQQG